MAKTSHTQSAPAPHCDSGHTDRSAPSEAPASADILAAAIDRARETSFRLFEGLAVLESMDDPGGAPQEIDAGALSWLAARFREQANEIAADLDHAQSAARGKPYGDAAEHFAAELKDLAAGREARS